MRTSSKPCHGGQPYADWNANGDFTHFLWNDMTFPLRPNLRSCNIAKMALLDQDGMKSMSARDAKNRFGFLIDTARQEPVSVEKHGRPVVVVLSVEDYERLALGEAHPGAQDGKASE